MNDPSHPLQNVFKLLLLLTDIICLYVGPIDLKTRFIPDAIGFLNYKLFYVCF